MNFFQNIYNSMWELFIRPPRQHYNVDELGFIKLLGPVKFKINSNNYQRNDYDIVNKQHLILKLSFFKQINRSDRPCIVILHANSSSRMCVQFILSRFHYIKFVLQMGFSLVIFDFSGSGNSQGEFISLGYNQCQDLEVVVKFLKYRLEIKSIILWGRSMGAVTALMYCKNNPMIRCLILDSPFSSLQKLIEQFCQQRIFFPNIFINLILDKIRQQIQSRIGYDIFKIKPINQIKGCKIPMMFIVSKNDTLVPYTHSQELYNICQAKKKILILNDGGHNSERSLEVKQQIMKFILQSLKIYHYQQKISKYNLKYKNRQSSLQINKTVKNLSKIYEDQDNLVNQQKKNIKNKKKNIIENSLKFYYSSCVFKQI